MEHLHIHLKTGENHVLILDAGLTTGFDWIFSPDNAKLVRVDRDADISSDTAGGHQKVRFRFTALEKGETDFLFEYKKPWEKGIPALKSIQVTVTVK